MTTRTLHLVDVDNLLGDPATTDGAEIDRALAAYRAAADYRVGDRAVVATDPRYDLHAAAIKLAWPQVGHRWRRGQDGADMALLDVADEAAASQRYDRVVIGSGDIIFLAALDQLRLADIEVDLLVGRRGSVSRALALRVGRVRYIEDFLARPAAA